MFCIFKEKRNFVTSKITQDIKITEYPYEISLFILMSYPNLFKILITSVFVLIID